MNLRQRTVYQIGMKMLIAVIVLLTGCIPSLQEIQTSCAQQYPSNNDRYEQCVQLGVADTEIKAARTRAVGAGLQQAGQQMQQRQIRCTTTCYIGSCYTTCQ